MPLITITENFGSNGNTIAQTIATKLDVVLFDDQRLQNIVSETGLSVRPEYHFDQHAPGFWERLRSREPRVYLDAMEAAVYDIARKGEGVIIGHGSQMLLRDFTCAFHVRLISDANSRVQNLIASQGLRREVAEELVAKYDKGQKAFFRYEFEIDLDVPWLYDLVINSAKLKTETITDLIMNAIQSDDIQACSLDALSSMQRLAQERNIHAQLLENNIDISTLHIEVPEIGTVDINGVAVSQQDMDRITEIANSVDGISRVNTNLSVWVYSI